MYSDVYTHTFAYVDLYMYTWRRIRSMLNAYIYYKRVHAFSHFPSRLSSPQKLDRVLLSYGFNSYRLRVNKLELELELNFSLLQSSAVTNQIRHDHGCRATLPPADGFEPNIAC